MGTSQSPSRRSSSSRRWRNSWTPACPANTEVMRWKVRHHSPFCNSLTVDAIWSRTKTVHRGLLVDHASGVTAGSQVLHAARAFADLPMQASCKCIVLAGILFIALVWPVRQCWSCLRLMHAEHNFVVQLPPFLCSCSDHWRRQACSLVQCRTGRKPDCLRVGFFFCAVGIAFGFMMYHNQLMCDISWCNWLNAFPLLLIWVRMALVRLHYWVYRVCPSIIPAKCQNVRREYPCKLSWTRCRQQHLGSYEMPVLPMESDETWTMTSSTFFHGDTDNSLLEYLDSTMMIKSSGAYYGLLIIAICKLIFEKNLPWLSI
jgi:hypothetical protein